MHGVPGIFVLREESLTPRAMQRLAEDLLNLSVPGAGSAKHRERANEKAPIEE